MNITVQASYSPEIVNALRQQLAHEFGSQIHAALRTLLQEKQLYQCERVSVPEFTSRYPHLINPASTEEDQRLGIQVNVGSKQSPRFITRSLNIEQLKSLNWIWLKTQQIQITFFAKTTPYQPVCEIAEGNSSLNIQMPIVSRYCDKCKLTTPHHPGFLGTDAHHPVLTLDPVPNNNGIQVFLLPYQCQQCRSEPLVFMLRRDGRKFQLTGRSLFIKEPIPEFVPEMVRIFYSESLVASSAGKPLAGCLYLRLVVEHHIRAFVEVPPKATGDELADAYAQALDPEFPKSRANLRVVYSELSEVIHSGREDGVVFERCLARLHEHFRALHVIPIPMISKETKPPESAPLPEVRTSARRSRRSSEKDSR